MSNLVPMEYRDQRIVTTRVLAEQYGTEEKNIQMNFLNNETRFEAGKHYYKLEGGELKRFKDSLPNNIGEPLKYAPTLILWTERGAARHAKILDTDEAWQVYEVLEETYFKVRENKPTCLEDILIAQLQEMKAMRQQVTEATNTANEVKQDLQNMRDVIALDPNSWREDTSRIINRIAQKLGGTEHIQDVRKEAYKLLDSRMGVDLQARLTNKRRRMADEGVCKSKRDKLNQLDVIADDKKLIEGFVAIVKQMAVKYGVAETRGEIDQ